MEIRLPRLLGSRLSARNLLSEQRFVGSSQVIMIDSRDVVSAAPSFVDELVKVFLDESDVSRIDLLAPSARVEHLFRQSLEARRRSEVLAIHDLV